MKLAKRLLASCVSLLMLLSLLPSALFATAEGTGEDAVSRYQVLQDALVEDQTLPYDSANNRYRLSDTVTLNQAVKDKFAAGEADDLALYLNLYIENTADPGNLDLLNDRGSNRQIVMQKFYEGVYYEVSWYYPNMPITSGWNQLLLSFSTTPDVKGAVAANKQSVNPEFDQTFLIAFLEPNETQRNYDIRVSNVSLVDTTFAADGTPLEIVDPDAPDYKKLQDVIPNQDFSYDAANDRFLINAKVSFNDEVKTAALEDLALYMDVYIDNLNDPGYLNFFADAGDGQLALQYYDSAANKYYEVRWRATNQFGAEVDWKRGWNSVLLSFSADHRDPDGISPYTTQNLLWDVEQSFQFRVNNMPDDKDYTGFKVRLANVSLVDTSRSESNPQVGEMKKPEHRAVSVINDRVAYLSASGTSYAITKPMDVDTSAMDKADLAVFANVYVPDGATTSNTTLSLTNDEGVALTWNATLQTGWNQLSLPLEDAAPAAATAAGFSSFSLSLESSAPQDIRLGTAWLVNTQAPYSETELTLSSAFGDHMLFQRNKPINVWGYAAAEDTVTVTLTETESGTVAGQAAVTAGQDNTFTATLPALDGSYTAYTLTIEDKDAVGVKSTQTFTDVVIGELWVASGQSNMELTVYNDNNSPALLAQAEEAQNTNIRYLKERSWPYGDNVEHPLTPNFDIIDTYWDTAANTTLLRNVSSIGYQFALQLQEQLDIPVGIVSNASGGSRIDCWISRDAIDGNEEIKAYLQGRGEYYDESNWPLANNRMSTLYNEVIGPLAGFEEGKGMQIAGTIWYQGEASLGFNGMYDKFLELLQEDWSRTFGFGEEEMPLIYAHIAPHVYGANISDQAEDMTRAYLRHTGSMAQVTLYDLPLIFENGDGSLNSVIHPTVKGPVAQRFYQAALDLLYGGTADATAPVYKSMTVTDDGHIRVTFDKVGEGLSVIGDGNDLHGFSIAGEDGVFVNAKAVIVSSDTVEVWNDRVANPQNVAYAYGNYVSASNLKNSAGFPAAAFRTTTTGTFYLPRDWTYADGKVWINYSTDREYADFLDMWGIAAGEATFSYDTEVKAEGAASLKLNYTGTGAAVTPIWNAVIDGVDTQYRGQDKNFQRYNYLTVAVSNPDDREKTLQLIIVSGGNSYTAVLANAQDPNATATDATLPASSGFTSYSFQLKRLLDSTGAVVSNATTVLQNLTEIRFSVTDTQGGTVYLDDVQFGMDNVDTVTVNKAALVAAIEKAEAIAQDGKVYAPDTQAALDDALAQALTLRDSDTATQAQVTSAAAALESAIAGLRYAAGDADGNGSVTSADALLALQAATSKVELSAIQLLAANVDSQGDVTAADALLILQYATEKITAF